jgi:hypothetical protein
MKRLFGKFSRPLAPVADDPEGPKLPDPAASDAMENFRPDALDTTEFELREPTPEEISATILSAQDFVDLDRIFGNSPAQARVIQAPKPPLLSPDVVPAQRTEVAAPPPPDASPAVTAPAQTPLQESIEQPAAAPVAVPPRLEGFLEGFWEGKALGGWVGDPKEPECRTIRVAALVDGKEVASTIANRQRKDIAYGGYHIPFPDLEISRYVLEDRLIVRAERDGIEPVTLPLLPGVFRQAREARARHIDQTGEKPMTPIVPRPRNADELTTIRIPIGMESTDGEAIVGREGFLFGYRDATNLLAQYAGAKEQEELTQRDAARWFALFQSRAAALTERGAIYVQTILPEKATILDDLTPLGLGPITARLAVLEAMVDKVLHDESVEAIPYYRSLIAALRSCYAAGVVPYLQTDSHLGTAGTQLVFYQLVQKMASLMPDRVDEFSAVADLCGQLVPGRGSKAISGDLGRHFAVPFYEVEQLPDLSQLRPYLADVSAIADMPKDRFAWCNPKAPSPLKIMAFGGSAFERGTGPHGLSWWFKAMFAEFHFVWSTELDLAHVEQHRPDVVLCMNIERSLPIPPPQ